MRNIQMTTSQTNNIINYDRGDTYPDSIYTRVIMTKGEVTMWILVIHNKLSCVGNYSKMTLVVGWFFVNHVDKGFW